MQNQPEFLIRDNKKKQNLTVKIKIVVFKLNS